MLASLARRSLVNVVLSNLKQTEKTLQPVLTRNYSAKVESDEEFDRRWEAYFRKYETINKLSFIFDEK